MLELFVVLKHNRLLGSHWISHFKDILNSFIKLLAPKFLTFQAAALSLSLRLPTNGNHIHLFQLNYRSNASNRKQEKKAQTLNLSNLLQRHVDTTEQKHRTKTNKSWLTIIKNSNFIHHLRSTTSFSAPCRHLVAHTFGYMAYTFFHTDICIRSCHLSFICWVAPFVYALFMHPHHHSAACFAHLIHQFS